MLKVKRLTRDDRNGTIKLVKKDIDFDMLSPAISRVLLEAIEQLAMLEKKAINEELLEIPYPIGSRMNLIMDGRQTMIEITGYELAKKEMVIIVETKEGYEIRLELKDALNTLKKIGSVNVT